MMDKSESPKEEPLNLKELAMGLAALPLVVLSPSIREKSGQYEKAWHLIALMYANKHDIWMLYGDVPKDKEFEFPSNYFRRKNLDLKNQLVIKPIRSPF